jgi:hypothetical protein
MRKGDVLICGWSPVLLRKKEAEKTVQGVEIWV